MKRLMTALLVLMILVSTVSAAEGNVIYDGTTQDFIFEPGSDYSVTDLFPNFKDVMPGDTLTQSITVRNDQDKQVKVEIYIRSLGAEEGSAEFLSKLGLKVAVADDNEMGYMFDAYADETAQLTDWVCLGMLYSGGEVNLDVTLDVPVELDNAYQDQVGYLTWEFMVIEYPVETDDPEPPEKTGDDTNLVLPVVLAVLCAVGVIVLIVWRKKNQGGEEDE